MGNEAGAGKKVKSEQQIIDNQSVIEQCIKQQGKFDEKQLDKMYEKNIVIIPEEHHTKFAQFAGRYLHRISNAKQYIKNNKKCTCKYSNANPEKLPIISISLEDWAHICSKHPNLYEALKTSSKRKNRFIYHRIERHDECKQNKNANKKCIGLTESKTNDQALNILSGDLSNDYNNDNIQIQPKQLNDDLLKMPSQPMLIRKPTQQCADAEGCIDFMTFCEAFKKIQKQPKNMKHFDDLYQHSIIYHVEDFPAEPCECKEWKSKSPEMQHIVHGHWFHRYELDKLQNEKQQTEKRKKTTPKNMRYLKKSSHTETFRDVLAKSPHKFDELQFGAPYTVEKSVDAKFANPKEEMLKNEYRPLSKSEWNDLLRKCVLFTKAIQARISKLSVKEIVALKLYTDFDELQRHFRKCFRLNEFKRQAQFFWWNRLLEAACTKSKDIISKKIYHGVSTELTLSTFSGTYYGPVSTTTIYDVARGFAGKNGNILELYPSFGRRGLKVSWLSNFPDEEEILYMNTSFQIHNVYGPSDSRPKQALIGGLNMSNIDQAYYFERSVMKAIQAINVESKVISLNINNKYLIEESDENEEIKEDDISGFVELSSRTQLAVLYLLYLQYRNEKWNDFMDNNSISTKEAFQRFRDEFVLLAENVKAVKMERLSKAMQVFFYTPQKQYIFPIAAYNGSRMGKEKNTVNFKKNQAFCIETIIRLFPNAEQISINAENWDFSLNHFIRFLQKFDMNYANVKLQDIYIKFVRKKYIGTSRKAKYEIITDDEEAQQLLKETMNAREQLRTLRKLGWRFVSGSHLHRVGFEPAPELPFVTVFVRARSNTKFYFQSYSMRFTKQQLEAIDILEEKEKESEPGIIGSHKKKESELEPGQIIKDTEGKSEEQIDDEINEGEKYVVVQHNPANCILNANIFNTLDYKDKLIALLKFRKENFSANYKMYQSKNAQKCKFIKLCEKVETLVLDPMPQKLKGIFMEYPKNQYHRGIISFETIYKMFPNVEEIFLRKTLLNLRICYKLIDFNKKFGDKTKLKRIFFNQSKDNGAMEDRHILRFRLVLHAHSWDIVKSECMLQRGDISTD